MLTANTGNDRTWTFVAEDFSNEVLETSKFSIKFKDADAAAAFSKAYNAAREANAALLAGKPAPAPAPAAPAAARAPPAVVDASGPVPVTDKLATIYGATLENEAIVRGSGLMRMLAGGCERG